MPSQKTYALLRNRPGLALSLLTLSLVILSIAISVGSFLNTAKADSSAQALPVSQNWSNTGLITANDNWSGVPGIEGYLGQDITTTTGADPQTLLTTSSVANDLDVIANQSATTITNGGVAEFDGIANPTIALQGSGTADAPYIILYLNTTGLTNIGISYNVRDLDCTTDNSIQQVALQYRVGNTGNFTNVAAGYVSDATTGPSLCTAVTAINLTLPAAVENQSLVQVRIMTTNAVGNDEWVGIDDISIVAAGGTPTPTPSPTLSINDVTQAEGDSGTSTFTFTVSLSAAAPSNVTFDIATADGTAHDGNPGGEDTDYVAQSVTGATITTGNTSTTFNVTVNGDTTTEPNETFFVNITNISGAGAGDVQGLGTINNDDVTLTTIHTIQGSGTTSPLATQNVTTRGIVTGIKSGSSGGFFIQEPDATVDADPNTSEGIFVFTGSSLPAGAVIGNSVQVSGTVQEFIPSSDLNQKPMTELSSSTTSVLSTGNSLPVPIALAAADTQVNNIENLERLEGMRISVSSLTVVAPTQGSITESSASVSSNGVFYGVVTGVARPFREPGINISEPLPAGAPANVPRFDENPERLRVDSDGQPGTTSLDVAAGTVITNVVGELEYAFRTWSILPELSNPPVVGTQPVATAVPTPTASEFTVASFNMERFFDTVNDPSTGDPVLTTAAFDRRVAKASLIIRTIQNLPDVIGVEEMENLSTLQAVAAKINADEFASSGVNPNYVAYLEEGNDVGGIDVGYLVKSSRVNVIDVTQFGKSTTYTDPNDGSTDILNDRPPLLLRARANIGSGGTVPFTVIVNHLRSLGDIDNETPSGSGTEGARVRAKRRAQAEYLANLIQARQVADPSELIITVGDMNAFQVNDGYVDVIGTIKGTPAPADQVTLASSDLVNPDLTDLVDALPADQRYSYTFDGNAQVLDHIILNTRAQTFLSRFAYARNDADFPVKNYGDTSVLRISDHDQPVAYFTNTPPTADSQLVSTNEDTPKVITLTGSDTQTASGNLTFTIVTGPTNGTLSPGTSGSVQTYTPNANYNGPDSFTFKVSDGAADSTPSTVSITVDAINDAPVNSGPAAQSVTENGSLTFSTGNSNLISIADVDAGANAVKVTLTATQGTITLSGISGLSFSAGDGTSDATMTFTGTIVNINAALNGMTFTPTAGSSGAASLQVTTDDQGNTGSGGALTDTDTVNITVNDGGTLQFSAANYSVGESAGNASITITRTGGTAGTATVQFSTSNGTATAGSDYTAVTNQTVTFNDGDTSKTVDIPISNDLIDESNETVNLTLTNAAGSGALGSLSTAVLTINDDDPPGGFIVFSSATYTIAEDGGSALITVNRVGTNTSAVSVDYATFDMTATERKDYATALGTLNFAAGEISKTFKVLVNRDAFTEGSEFLGLTLSNVTGGADLAVPQNATLQIDDVAWIGPPANPIDQIDFFVIQHYHDFLNREPDAAGLAYWTDNIHKCNDPARRLPGTTTEQCIEIQRINTSAAFFLSIEFQETGVTAYLAHKSAFNAVPSYLRFQRDTQRLQRDFIFGTPGAAAVLEANKVAYFNKFVAGSDFTAIYGLLNNDQYVDALIANTGVTFTSSERGALVNGLNNSTETRATVLRKITEKSTFREAEFTRAFVLMEYFGYLRRDPDPDGFNYWLNKLNSFNGNYIHAEMVKAFLSSFEYRERFGL